LQRLVEHVVQQAIEIAGLGLAADNLPLAVEPQWRAHHRARALLCHVVDLQMADRWLDAPPPPAGLLGDGARFVLDGHDFLAVAIPQIGDGLLSTRQSLLGLGLFALCPLLGLRRLLLCPRLRLPLLVQRLGSLAGAPRLAQLGELLLGSSTVQPSDANPRGSSTCLPAIEKRSVK